MTVAAKIIALPRRRRRSVVTPLFAADVHPFPLTRRIGEVDKLARHVRALPTIGERRAYMMAFANRAWSEWCDKGAEGIALEGMLIQFVQAVWREVDRRDLGGVA